MLLHFKSQCNNFNFKLNLDFLTFNIFESSNLMWVDLFNPKKDSIEIHNIPLLLKNLRIRKKEENIHRFMSKNLSVLCHYLSQVG